MKRLNKETENKAAALPAKNLFASANLILAQIHLVVSLNRWTPKRPKYTYNPYCGHPQKDIPSLPKQGDPKIDPTEYL